MYLATLKSVRCILALICSVKEHLSLVVRNAIFGIIDQVPHKQDCKTTEDG